MGAQPTNEDNMKKKAKPQSLRQRLNKAIRDDYPGKHYSIEFQCGVIGGIRRHQDWDDKLEWTWTGHYQDWKAGLGFGRLKDGDNFCLQINRRYYESERLWGWEAGNYLEDHLYVTIENGDFILKGVGE